MGVAEGEISKAILELEKSFIERRSIGDNRGHLDNHAEEVSYFDPVLKELTVGRDKGHRTHRVDLLNARIVRSEYLSPQVHVSAARSPSFPKERRDDGPDSS